MTMGVLLGCFRQVQVKFGVAVGIFIVMFWASSGEFWGGFGHLSSYFGRDFGHFYRDVLGKFR